MDNNLVLKMYVDGINGTPSEWTEILTQQQELSEKVPM